MNHDECRDTKRFKQAGQNLGYRSSTVQEPLDEFLRNTIDAWYSEKKDANMDMIRNCCGGDRFHLVGHFLQNVQATITHVGCALAQYTEDGKWKTYLLACNYSKTNMLKKPVYTSGKSASACKNGRSAKYSNLCSI
jgi:hypothetical protein